MADGRHVRNTSTRSWRALAFGLVAVVAVVAVVAAGIGLVRTNGVGRPDPCRAGRTGVTVVASPDIQPLLADEARRYQATRPRVDDRCVGLTVAAMESSAAAQGLAAGWSAQAGPRPDVWVPASTVWTRVVAARAATAARALLPNDAPKLARSPLVLAMPRPMAQALGWPRAQPTWQDLFKALGNQKGWAMFGHPEWGIVKVGKTDPTVSTPGLNASVATFAAVAGGPDKLTPQMIGSGPVREQAVAIQRSPGEVAATPGAFLSNLLRADDRGQALAYTSAVALDEKSVLDYNSGNPTGNPASAGRHAKPKVPLAAVYPQPGTLESDHPYLVLQAAWVDDAKRRAATGFLAWLQDAPAQQRLMDAGFRNAANAAGPRAVEANGLLPDRVGAVLPPPEPKVVAPMAGIWQTISKRGNVLAVIDVSGSMRLPVPGLAATKLDLVKRAAGSAVGLFAPDDRVGLWVFAAGLDGPKDYRVLVPLGGIEDLVGGVQRRALLVGRMATMTPTDHATGLYDTTLAAVGYVKDHYTDGRINTVVLLTDGRNEKRGGLTLAELLARLKAANATRPVRVITLGYGADADLDALRQISQATGGVLYASASLADIQRLFVLAIENF